VLEPPVKEFRLLPGEEHSSAPNEDARHWVGVYLELVEFCELMLARPELALEDGHLRRRLGHYRAGLEAWQAAAVRSSAAAPWPGSAPDALVKPVPGRPAATSDATAVRAPLFLSRPTGSWPQSTKTILSS
jgi:hypothetical protein